MNALAVAVRVEALKLRRSPVGLAATALLVGGSLALMAAVLVAIHSGNAQVAAKAGNIREDWPGLLALAHQVGAAVLLLGDGVVLTWMMAREFADGTVTALFALPVRPGVSAAAKLVVHQAWAALTAGALGAGVVALGVALGLGAPDRVALAGVARLVVLGLFSAWLAVAVGWVAGATRSLLGGVAAAVGLLVLAQVGALAGLGPWFPLSGPALWAAGGLGPGPLLGPALLGALAVAGVLRGWSRLQLDR